MVGRYRLPLLIVLALFLSGCTTGTQEEAASDSIVVDGKLPAAVPGLKAGPRFLKQVEWPDHIANPLQTRAEDEKPGDGYDDGLLVTKRRHTDRSFYEKEWTPGLTLSGVHGTEANPICVCDAEFVFENKDGMSPTPSVKIIGSSWILVDNVTIYGGFGLSLEGGHNVTVTRSMFIASHGIALWDDIADVRVIDNDFIGHMGPTQPYSNAPGGLHDCWPDPQGCWTASVSVIQADRVTVMHNYHDGGNGISSTAGPVQTKIIHNTFYHGARMEVSEGAAEISWNLARGWSSALMKTGGGQGTRIENNSLVLTTKVNPFRFVLDQHSGLDIRICDACVVRNNDFVGFGYGFHGNGGSPAMMTLQGSIDASDNYWGYLHDPRLPPDVIIWNVGTELKLQDWDLVPNHDLNPIVVAPSPDDANYWIDRLSP